MNRQQAIRICVIMFVIIGIFFSLQKMVPMEAAELDNKSLNGEVENTKDMLPFYWTVGIVGGCIAVTLSYVSWRKYKGEEKKQHGKGPNS